MKAKLTDPRKRWPNVFKDCVDFSIGEGWWSLVNELIEKNFKDPESWLEVAQVKEKFGGLRFYPRGALSITGREAVAKAESESYKICEICGSKRGVLRSGTWLRTLCARHAEGRKAYKGWSR